MIRAFIQNLLLRWAYGPLSGSLLRNLMRKIARGLLHTGTDAGLQVGAYHHVIAMREPTLQAGSNFRHVTDSFSPLNLPVTVGGGLIVETGAVEVHSVAPPAERSPDPDVQDWLDEVTEPYILWDSPKPDFLFSTDYFYDYAEPVIQLHVPPYVRPGETMAHREPNPRDEVFRSLSHDRKLFTLSPEAVRLRSARLKDGS